MQAIVFDCFDTLVDSGTQLVVGSIRVLRRLGLEIDPRPVTTFWRQAHRHYCNGPFACDAELLRRSFDDTLALLGYRIRCSHAEELLDSMQKQKLFAEARPVLERLYPHYRLFVASNGDRAVLETCLAPVSDLLSGILSSEELRCYKPHAHFYSGMLDHFGLEVDQTLYVGDDLVDDFIGPREQGLAAQLVHVPPSDSTKALHARDLTTMAERLLDQKRPTGDP